jgi:hypothetical protein
MRRVGNIACLCFAIAATLALAIAPASAHKHKAHKARKAVDSAMTLDSVSADGFSGRLSTAERACRDQRQVTVYMVNSSGSVPSSVPFGTAVTRSDGSWSLGGWAYPGEYYAVAAQSKTKRLLCESAMSNSKSWWTSPG